MGGGEQDDVIDKGFDEKVKSCGRGSLSFLNSFIQVNLDKPTLGNKIKIKNKVANKKAGE